MDCLERLKQLSQHHGEHEPRCCRTRFGRRSAGDSKGVAQGRQAAELGLLEVASALSEEGVDSLETLILYSQAGREDVGIKDEHAKRLLAQCAAVLANPGKTFVAKRQKDPNKTPDTAAGTELDDMAPSTGATAQPGLGWEGPENRPSGWTSGTDPAVPLRELTMVPELHT